MTGTNGGIAETTAAFLLLAALIVLATGAVAVFLIIRNRYRRDLPKRRHRRTRPVTPDPWQEAANRLDIEPASDGDDPDDDDPEDPEDDDDDDGEPTPPVPSSPSLATQC